MIHRAGIAVMFAGMLTLASSASAKLKNIPLDVIVWESDLIVLGEVMEEPQSVTLKIQEPGETTPPAAERKYKRYKIKVTDTLKANPLAGKEIQVIEPDRPGKCYAGANLKKGQSYVLVLSKLPQKDEYFLPYYPKHHIAANDKKTRTQILRILENWEWGRPVNGLQLGIANPVTVQRSYVTWEDVNTKTTTYHPTLSFSVLVGLRNVSKKPIAVALYPGDPKGEFLTLAARRGKTIKQNTSGVDIKAAPFAETHIYRIPPGKMILISPLGRGAAAPAFSALLDPGQWQLQATLTATRPKNLQDKPLWTGTLKTQCRISVMPEIPPTITGRLREALDGIQSPQRVDWEKASKTIVQMGKETLPAIPVLIDMLNEVSLPGSLMMHRVRYTPCHYAAAALGDLAKELGPDILSPGLKHPNVMVRCNTIWLLGQIPKPAAKRLLISMLQDKTPEVRIAAIEACQLSLSDADTKLILPLLKDKSPEVRAAAANAFYLPLESKDDALKNKVLKALRDATGDSSTMVRRYAAYSLAEQGDTTAVPDIIRLLKDSNLDVRQTAIYALDKIGDARAVPILEAMLKTAGPNEKETITRLIKKLSQN